MTRVWISLRWNLKTSVLAAYESADTWGGSARVISQRLGGFLYLPALAHLCFLSLLTSLSHLSSSVKPTTYTPAAHKH